MLLKAFKTPESLLPAHDDLDDLESFLWILCYLIIIYDPDGSINPENISHETVGLWKDPTQVYRAKNTFLSSETIPDEAAVALHPDWQYICIDLFLGFRGIIQAACKAKEGRLFKTEKPRKGGTGLAEASERAAQSSPDSSKLPESDTEASSTGAEIVSLHGFEGTKSAQSFGSNSLPGRPQLTMMTRRKVTMIEWYSCLST